MGYAERKPIPNSANKKELINDSGELYEWEETADIQIEAEKLKQRIAARRAAAELKKRDDELGYDCYSK
jgi:hypothetical protein|tara:strand:+ start:724 stop:930 length:207 start_codon:yes stop_codon:yes gene_type:complete